MIIQSKNKEEMANLIKECFATDKALIENWHIAAPASLEECVERTVSDMKYADPSLQLFAAYENSELAGYWGVEHGYYINLIFVKPQYRNKEFMREFWKEITKDMPNLFCTAIYSKNKPAAAFYSKLGKKTEDFTHEGNQVSRYIFEKEANVCR
jgi:hypothetical protein